MNETNRSDANELVILLHGFAASRRIMRLLQKRLDANGYRTMNWGYRSLVPSVATHAEKLRDLLEHQLSSESRVHVVAHSMGSIITRAALCETTPINLGRLVFLAPPNHGSPIARLVELSLGRVYKPLVDLSDRADSFVNELPSEVNADFGIIAAKYDHLVPLVSTHLPGQSGHVVVPATHSSLLFSQRTADHVSRFLSVGRFMAAGPR